MVTAEISDRHRPDVDTTHLAPEPPGTLAIGLDVGGSKIAAGLFDVGSRTSLATRRAATRPSRGGGAVLDDCAGLVEELVAETSGNASRTPLGIGICELVGPDGEITTAANFDWRGL